MRVSSMKKHERTCQNAATENIRLVKSSIQLLETVLRFRDLTNIHLGKMPNCQENSRQLELSRDYSCLPS